MKKLLALIFVVPLALLFVDAPRSQTVGPTVPIAGQIVGTATNDSAAAGNIGEYVVSTVLAGSQVSLTSGAQTNITSISLTPGDWDIWFNGVFSAGGTTNSTLLTFSISSTTGTADLTPPHFGAVPTPTAGLVGGLGLNAVAGPFRVSLSATTTYFAVAQTTFTISTLAGYGSLQARRRR